MRMSFYKSLFFGIVAKMCDCLDVAKDVDIRIDKALFDVRQSVRFKEWLDVSLCDLTLSELWHRRE